MAVPTDPCIPIARLLRIETFDIFTTKGEGATLMAPSPFVDCGVG